MLQAAVMSVIIDDPVGSSKNVDCTMHESANAIPTAIVP
jgi:hypothetical protein